MTLRYWTHFSTIIFIHALILLGGWQVSRDPKMVSSAVSSVNATIIRIAAASTVLRAAPVIPQKKLIPTTNPKAKAAPKEEPQVASAPIESGAVGAVESNGLSGMARADLRSMFLGELRAQIEANKNYPMMSRRLGQTGIVEVAFTLTHDGHIINARIVSPSRYDRLNESALEAVKKIARFRPIPSELKEEKMDVTVPVKFAIL